MFSKNPGTSQSKYKKIMSKLHPDRNDADTTKLAQIVSEAKETILKNDFN